MRGRVYPPPYPPPCWAPSEALWPNPRTPVFKLRSLTAFPSQGVKNLVPGSNHPFHLGDFGALWELGFEVLGLGFEDLGLGFGNLVLGFEDGGFNFPWLSLPDRYRPRWLLNRAHADLRKTVLLSMTCRSENSFCASPWLILPGRYWPRRLLNRLHTDP